MIAKEKLVQILGSNVVRVIYGMALMVFITNHYTMEIAGSYFLVLAIMTFLNDLKEGFFLSGFIKYLVEEKGNLKIATTGLITSLTWDVGSFLLFIGVSLWSPELSVFIVAYLVNLLLSSFFKWVTYIHRARVDTSVQLKSNLISLATVIVGASWIYFYSLPIQYCLVILGLSNFLPCILLKTNLSIINQTVKTLTFDKATFKKLGYFGKFGVLLSVVGSLSHQSGIFLSAEFLDLGQTALLGLGARYAILLTLPGNSISSLIYPEILKCKGNIGLIKEVGIAGVGKMYSILIPLGLIIILFSPLGIYLLHGKSYLFVSVIIAFKTVVLLINLPLSSAYTSVMNALNKPYFVSQLVIINSLVNLVLIAPLMYYFGIWGALIAPFSIEIIGFIMMRSRLRKEVDFPFGEIPYQIKGYWMYWWKKYLLPALRKIIPLKPYSLQTVD